MTALQAFHDSQRPLTSIFQVKITVQLLGQARQLSPTERVILNVEEGASVDELVPHLLTGAPDSLHLILSERSNEAQQLRRSVMAIRNNETIEPSARDLLRDGDEVSLLPPMSGG
tara:strand:+ start:43 stop:387 length:345 start_codon:yes stop_codon:yes gene_type:complete